MGSNVVLELIASTFAMEEVLNNEISNQVLSRESSVHSDTEDIVRLPLKLPFPSLPLEVASKNESDYTICLTGPDGNVRKRYHKNSVI